LEVVVEDLDAEPDGLVVGGLDAEPDELVTALEDEEIPTTAAVISAAVASSTKRFCEKIHPSISSATSHVLPLPVSSVSFSC
jgi:hypothetical protein